MRLPAVITYNDGSTLLVYHATREDENKYVGINLEEKNGCTFDDISLESIVSIKEVEVTIKEKK